MILLHLPFPPSTNRLWRKGKGGVIYIDPKYAAWKREADAMFLSQKLILNGKRIHGGFDCFMTLDEKRRRRASDLDNRIKAVLDALQRWKVIDDDKLADRLTASWGPAQGCVVALYPSEKEEAAS